MTNSEEFNQPELLYMQASPCLNPNIDPVCKEYCKFHQDLFLEKFLTKEEFLTLMQLTLPSTSLKMPKFSKHEISLGQKLFGNVEMNSNFHQIASMALPIYCKTRRNQNWQGDDIGLDYNFCSDFHMTPTDVGVCMTKNLQLSSILNFPTKFSDIFRPEPEAEPVKVQGGTYWGEASFVLDTKVSLQGMFPREDFKLSYEDEDPSDAIFSTLQKVQLKLQSPAELPSILHEANHATDLISIPLEAGNEYDIKIVAKSQMVTERFKALDLFDRQCLLKEEVSDSKWFKFYNLNNCQYECKVKLAYRLENGIKIPNIFQIWSILKLSLLMSGNALICYSNSNVSGICFYFFSNLFLTDNVNVFHGILLHLKHKII